MGLPFPAVQVIFRWTLAALTGISVLLWLRVVDWKPSGITALALLALTLATFWVVQGIRLQQLTLLVGPIIWASVYFLIKNRQVPAATLLGLATVKPQIAMPLAAWLIMWACSRIHLRWKFVTAFAVTLLTLGVVGELLLPGWISEFYAAMVAYRGYTRHVSPLDELATPSLGIPLSLAIGATVTVLFWRAPNSAPTSGLLILTTSLRFPANLLVIPPLSPYTPLLLFP